MTIIGVNTYKVMNKQVNNSPSFGALRIDSDAYNYIISEVAKNGVNNPLEAIWKLLRIGERSERNEACDIFVKKNSGDISESSSNKSFPPDKYPLKVTLVDRNGTLYEGCSSDCFGDLPDEEHIITKDYFYSGLKDFLAPEGIQHLADLADDAAAGRPFEGPYHLAMSVYNLEKYIL